ncbi:hypothetical protein ACQP2F_28405 [Actinoplanes sp. CA-030573]|uniref:hypothetical protein n=1 Tax=Actinoplanes sp. CA-030573 TaxID=3239898 RepID=UPI003D8EE1D9
MTDAAEDWIRSWSSSISERAAAAHELSDRVARLTVDAADVDHLVTATVNGSDSESARAEGPEPHPRHAPVPR